MNRTCKRCGYKQSHEKMHYNKQQGWLCNNREDCTLRVNNPGKCPHKTCVNKTLCSADYPNKLCFEEEK